MAIRISAVINTLNEEKNLGFALRSIRSWVDEIIVVDMYSNDRTVEIAREFKAEVYFHKPAGYADPARAFALSKATGDWILILDADEIVPEPLSRRLIEFARDGSSADVVKIPRLNYMLGAPMGFTGWGPHQDKQLRFFRRGIVDANETIHNYLNPASHSRILELPFESGLCLVHFPYSDTFSILEKLNRYTTIEARQALGRGEKGGPARALFNALKEFITRYLKAGGYRDGWRGLHLSIIMGVYRLLTYLKLEELREIGEAESVVTGYGRTAERTVSAYALPGEDPLRDQQPSVNGMASSQRADFWTSQ